MSNTNIQTKPSTSRANVLAEGIRKRIETEEYSEGDFFMTHAQLAQEYEVSLNTVREAVSRLRGLGILEGRQKKGLIVGRLNPMHLLPRSLATMVGSKKEFQELARLRYVLEVGAIEFAVRNATDEQIEQLEQLTRDFRDSEEMIHGQSDIARGIELDLAFHSQILKMTQSPMIAEMQQVLAQFFSRVATDVERQETVWEHEAIAAAIRARDVEQARSMIRLHFRFTIEM